MRIEKCAHKQFCDAGKIEDCPHCDEDQVRALIPKRFLELGDLHFVGKGSVSSVFHISGERDYALKIIPCGEDAGKLQNALYEIRVMKACKGNCRAVQLLDSEITEEDGQKTVFLLESYHQPMRELLANRSYTALDALKLIIGICDALIALKTAEILHLDVQPKNIFADSFDEVLLGDFSSSLFFRDLGSNLCMRGTPLYLAPEVVREELCTEQSDLYSVGLILYTLFHAHTLPFADSCEERLALCKRMAGAVFPAISYPDAGIEQELNRIICRACAYERSLRYTDLDAFRNDLKALLQTLRNITEVNLVLVTGPQLPAQDSATLPASAPESDEDLLAAKNALFDADSLATSVAILNYDKRWDETADLPTPPVRCRVCDNNVVSGARFCPYCGCKIVLEKPSVDFQRVHFTAAAPKQLVTDAYNIVTIIMYEEEFRRYVDERISSAETPTQEKDFGIRKVPKISEIMVVLSSPDIEIDDDTETGLWQGEYLEFSFAFRLPEGFSKHEILLTAQVYTDAVLLTKLKIPVACVSQQEQKIQVTRKDYKSAFVSYAHEDRKKVATIIQGMQKVRPDLNLFFDIESLRSGENWKQRLYSEIENRDLLFLCWSHFAKESEWVEKEWRFALEKKGIDGIEPVPIELPVPSPPKELSEMHFNDVILHISDI